MKDGGPAFPSVEPSGVHGIHDEHVRGMSLRDWFAGQALAGLAADGDHAMSREASAEWCYEMADTMLAERDKEAK